MGKFNFGKNRQQATAAQSGVNLIGSSVAGNGLPDEVFVSFKYIDLRDKTHIDEAVDNIMLFSQYVLPQKSHYEYGEKQLLTAVFHYMLHTPCEHGHDLGMLRRIFATVQDSPKENAHPLDNLFKGLKRPRYNDALDAYHLFMYAHSPLSDLIVGRIIIRLDYIISFIKCNIHPYCHPYCPAARQAQEN